MHHYHTVTASARACKKHAVIMALYMLHLLSGLLQKVSQILDTAKWVTTGLKLDGGVLFFFPYFSSSSFIGVTFS